MYRWPKGETKTYCEGRHLWCHRARGLGVSGRGTLITSDNLLGVIGNDAAGEECHTGGENNVVSHCEGGCLSRCGDKNWTGWIEVMKRFKEQQQLCHWTNNLFTTTEAVEEVIRIIAPELKGRKGNSKQEVRLMGGWAFLVVRPGEVVLQRVLFSGARSGRSSVTVRSSGHKVGVASAKNGRCGELPSESMVGATCYRSLSLVRWPSMSPFGPAVYHHLHAGITKLVSFMSVGRVISYQIYGTMCDRVKLHHD